MGSGRARPGDDGRAAAPDHTTIARFRQRHETALGELFGEVLALCAGAGLIKVGVIAIDGTKVHANALQHASREYSQAGRMGEYLAQAEAHLAWAALRRGDRRQAESHMKAARPLWEPLWSSPHGLLGWIIGWPEIALALDHGRVAEAGAQARVLLEPARHPMPDDLSAALESAVQALERRGEESAREPFERAAALAVRDGYL